MARTKDSWKKLGMDLASLKNTEVEPGRWFFVGKKDPNHIVWSNLGTKCKCLVCRAKALRRAERKPKEAKP